MEKENQPTRVTRRSFIRDATLFTTGLVLTACGGRDPFPPHVTDEQKALAGEEDWTGEPAGSTQELVDQLQKLEEKLPPDLEACAGSEEVRARTAEIHYSYLVLFTHFTRRAAEQSPTLDSVSGADGLEFEDQSPDRLDLTDRDFYSYVKKLASLWSMQGILEALSEDNFDHIRASESFTNAQRLALLYLRKACGPEWGSFAGDLVVNPAAEVNISQYFPNPGFDPEEVNQVYRLWAESARQQAGLELGYDLEASVVDRLTRRAVLCTQEQGEFTSLDQWKSTLYRFFSLADLGDFTREQFLNDPFIASLEPGLSYEQRAQILQDLIGQKVKAIIEDSQVVDGRVLVNYGRVQIEPAQFLEILVSGGRLQDFLFRAAAQGSHTEFGPFETAQVIDPEGVPVYSQINKINGKPEGKVVTVLPQGTAIPVLNQTHFLRTEIFDQTRYIVLEGQTVGGEKVTYYIPQGESLAYFNEVPFGKYFRNEHPLWFAWTFFGNIPSKPLGGKTMASTLEAKLIRNGFTPKSVEALGKALFLDSWRNPSKLGKSLWQLPGKTRRNIRILVHGPTQAEIEAARSKMMGEILSEIYKTNPSVFP